MRSNAYSVLPVSSFRLIPAHVVPRVPPGSEGRRVDPDDGGDGRKVRSSSAKLPGPILTVSSALR